MTAEGSHQKDVLVIGTGGTISAVGTDPLDLYDYPMSGERLRSKDLVESVPKSLRGINIFASGFQPVSSTELGPGFWQNLLQAIHEAKDQYRDLAGIVVTHGTATLEETAFVVDLFADVHVPVVFTGAQRPVNAISSDAAFNLTSAIQVAASHEARAKGVLVVMNGEIHAASEVSKTENFSLAAFRSDPGGALGACDGVSTVFRRSVRRRVPKFQWKGNGQWPRVDIIMSYAGCDGVLIDSAVDAGAKGIVVAGLAPGYATPEQRTALLRAQENGVKVVMSSRAQCGPTLTLAQNGIPNLIGSGVLNPAKARVLLAAGLISGMNEDSLRFLFEHFA